MPKKSQPVEIWKTEPEDHDFPAAADYLSLVLAPTTVTLVVDRLRAAESVERKAKDLMRASLLTLLPLDNGEVAKDIKRVEKGERLSPVLLLRGDAVKARPLVVADGYHRICASYHLNEDVEIPCRIADLK